MVVRPWCRQRVSKNWQTWRMLRNDRKAYHCANMFFWWSKIPRIRNNVNIFTTLTLYPIVTVTGQRFRNQRSSLLLLALGYRPNKNRKTPLELELKAGHAVVTSRSGILDSGNAHTLPATGHGRGVSPKLHSDWFGAVAAGFVQKTLKERIWMSQIAKKNDERILKDVVNAGKRVGSWSEMDRLISDIVRLHKKTCLRPFLMGSTWSNLNESRNWIQNVFVSFRKSHDWSSTSCS